MKTLEIPPAVNTLFPVFLKLEQLHTLLVGAGNIGLEKINALLNNAPNAQITVVAQEVSEAFFQRVDGLQNVHLQIKPFEISDMQGKDIVIVASNNPPLNEKLYALARAQNLLINVADKPDLCDFYLGSVVQKGNLKIGISTNGQSPTIAKRLKEVLNESIPMEINETLQNMQQLRTKLTGDFTEKVKYLNKVTAPLSTKKTEKKGGFWSKTKLISLAVIVSILLIVTVLAITQPQVGAFFTNIHANFYYFMIAGFIFSLIDGAIGMSYGVTSTTFALSMGIPPASASAAVHISEVFTNGIAGFMHYRLKNVNKKMFLYLVIPGAIAAGLGAYLLSSLEHYSQYTRPVVSIYTFILGLIILRKAFTAPKNKDQRVKKISNIGFLGFGGGFIDAVGGGGWGSIVLSSLIAGGRNARYALGTVKLSRFFIAVISSITFILMLGSARWEAILGLLIGSSIASPLGVKLSGKISVKTIMVAVGIIVMLTSAKGVMNFVLKTIH